MATYYVCAAVGSDSNNGLGPDASHGSNKPWATLGKALGAAGISSGDTVYVGPGVQREVVTVAMTSASAETSILGDPSNAQGFADGSGNRVAPGYVIWTAYTTDDETAPASSSLLTLASRDHLTFANLWMVGGGTGNSALEAAAGSTNITFRDCLIQGSNPASGTGARTINIAVSADAAATWVFDRCIIQGVMGGSSATNGGVVVVSLPTSASADYDASVVLRNCLIFGVNSTCVMLTSSGAGAFDGGGVDVLNSTLVTQSRCLDANNANLSTSIPCTVYGSLLIGGVVLEANTSGQILEDYNYLYGTTLRTNVSAGSNSVSAPDSALLLEWGQAELWGFASRPYMTPAKGSPLLSFGGSSPPSVDLLNRPRPSGSGVASTAGVLTAVGAYERHNTAQQETTTVDASGSGIKIVGPGNHDLKVPVDASATTISIKARFDTAHAATNKPQVLLLANPALGVTAETLTMTAAVDTWETLTTASQTPTAKGVVTLRLVSRSAAGNGSAFFDTVA